MSEIVLGRQKRECDLVTVRRAELAQHLAYVVLQTRHFLTARSKRPRKINMPSKLA
jgi:hypothetical protein